MRSKVITTLISAALLAVNLQAADRWLHMRVTGADGTRVSMNLPFSVVEKAAPLLPTNVLRHPRIECNGERLDSAAFRNAVRQTATTGSAAYDENDHHVVVTRAGGTLLVVATETDGSDTVRLRIPASIVDSMAGNRDDEIDLRAAVQAMVQQGTGDLMIADTNDATVRIWIDDKP